MCVCVCVCVHVVCVYKYTCACTHTCFATLPPGQSVGGCLHPQDVGQGLQPGSGMWKCPSDSCTSVVCVG